MKSKTIATILYLIGSIFFVLGSIVMLFGEKEDE